MSAARVIGYGLTVTALTAALVASGSMAAATGPTEPVIVYEVGLYVYKKLDPTLPAAWANSGEQTFITAVPGSDWFTTFPGVLPEFVCGPDWGVQQDEIKHDGTFVWPVTITYPNNVLSQAKVLIDAKHADLETLTQVPDCATEPTPEPTRTVDPTPVPPLEPPTVERLPETGLESWFWVLFVVALGLFATGWTAVRKPHDSSTTTTGEQ